MEGRDEREPTMTGRRGHQDVRARFDGAADAKENVSVDVARATRRGSASGSAGDSIPRARVVASRGERRRGTRGLRRASESPILSVSFFGVRSIAGMGGGISPVSALATTTRENGRAVLLTARPDVQRMGDGETRSAAPYALRVEPSRDGTPRYMMRACVAFMISYRYRSRGVARARVSLRAVPLKAATRHRDSTGRLQVVGSVAMYSTCTVYVYSCTRTCTVGYCTGWVLELSLFVIRYTYMYTYSTCTCTVGILPGWVHVRVEYTRTCDIDN